MTTTLNRDTVTALQLDGKSERFVFDTDPALTGFGIRLRNDRNGRLTKTWFVQYRTEEHQRRRKIGRFPTLNADAARKLAASWLSKLSEGRDPADDRDQRREAAKMKFIKAVDDYLLAKKDKVRDSSLRLTRLYLRNERYFGKLHGMPVSRITKSHVTEALDAIDAQSGTVTAGRCRAHLSAFCSWLIEGGHVEVNPCIGSRKFEQGDGRERVLEDHELAAVWNNVDMDTDFGRIIRLLALTGARRQEIGNLRWSEVDLEAGTISLPKERTKNGKAFKLPLVDEAVQILRDAPRKVGREFVFGDRGEGFSSWTRSKRMLDRAIKIEHFTVHDLRRTLRSGLGKLGVPPHIAERALNHVQGGVDAKVYDRCKYEAEIANAFGRWADHVQSITGGERKVIPIKQSA
jgi:integrase